MSKEKKLSIPEITKDEFIDAIRDGVKDAILTMTDSGDGFTGPIIREPFLDSIRIGVKDALEDNDSFETLADKLGNISDMLHELGTEIFKYRMDKK